MEHREVDQSIRCQEEVGNDGSNYVELSCKQENISQLSMDQSSHLQLHDVWKVCCKPLHFGSKSNLTSYYCRISQTRQFIGLVNTESGTWTGRNTEALRGSLLTTTEITFINLRHKSTKNAFNFKSYKAQNKCTTNWWERGCAVTTCSICVVKLMNIFSMVVFLCICMSLEPGGNHRVGNTIICARFMLLHRILKIENL